MAAPASSLPFILLNLSLTADGKIATANRAVSSFGSKRDHDHLLELRATADAVMAGARTVDSAAINMGPGGTKYRRQRLQRGLAEYNLRIIVTGSGSIASDAHVFKHRFSPIIILTTKRASASALRRLRSLADEVKVFGPARSRRRKEADVLDLRAALRWLNEKWHVNRLLCEGGGDLNDALFRADLVDEIHLTICPQIFAGRTAPTISEGRGFPSLPQAGQFKFKSVKQIGNELFVVLNRKPR